MADLIIPWVGLIGGIVIIMGSGHEVAQKAYLQAAALLVIGCAMLFVLGAYPALQVLFYLNGISAALPLASW